MLHMTSEYAVKLNMKNVKYFKLGVKYLAVYWMYVFVVYCRIDWLNAEKVLVKIYIFDDSML